MSSFTGGRVREPKVRSYVRPLHVDMESYKTSGISDGVSSGVNRSMGSHDDLISTRRTNRSFTTQFPSHHHSTGIKPSHSDSTGMSLKRSPYVPHTKTVHVTSKPIRKSVSDEYGDRYHGTTNTLPQSRSWLPTTTTNGTQSDYRGTYSSTRDLPSYRGTSPNRRDVPSNRGTSPNRRDVPSFSSSQSTFRSSSSSSVKVPSVTLDTEHLSQPHKPMIRKTHSASRWSDTHSYTGKDPTLHLPQETISSLQETIKRQKQEFNNLKGKMSRKTVQAPPTVVSRPREGVTSVHRGVPLPMKKRKVATAPPPKTYAGFTSTIHGAPPLKTGPRHAPSTITNGTSTLETSEQTQVPHPPTITPYTWRSGQETVNKVLNKKRPVSKLSDRTQQPRLPTSTLDQLTALNNSRTDALLLLQDLEEKNSEDRGQDSEGEELEEQIRSEKRKQPSKGPSPVATKLRKILESNSIDEVQESPKVVERHYDRDAVRKYMKSKEEEKRRKKKEEKDAVERAQNEKERKLKDLQERQRQILVGNIMHQKRQQQYTHDIASPLLHYTHSDDDSMISVTPPPPTSSVYNTVPSPPASVGVSLPRPPSPVSYPTHRASPRINLTSPPSAYVLPQTPPTGSTSVTPTHLLSVSGQPPKGATPTSTSPVTISPSRSPIRTSDQHQARILALKQSAIALREKIQAQRKTMATQGLYSSPRAKTTPTLTTPTLPQQTGQLPRVSNLYEHASTVRQQLQENKAATKIQSVWKGYKQRKSIRPTTNRVESPQTTPYIQVSPPIIAQSPILSTQGASRLYTPPIRPPPVVSKTTPTSQGHVVSPWLRPGGDPMSVVNIYTRKQEELKKLLKTREPIVVGTTEYGQDEVDEVSSSRSSSGSVSPAAITPPESSLEYDESFVTPPIYQTPPPRTIPHSATSQQPRYSPHTLQMKLLTELNVLEAVGEGVRHLEGVESTKAVAEAQQETVTLAQILKTQKQTHTADIDSITSKAKRDSELAQREFQKLSEEANKLTQRMRQIEEQSKVKDERHTQELKKVQAVTCQKVDDVNQQLLSVQSSVSTAIMEANEKQFQSAHDMAVGVAKAAAEGAVQAALRKQEKTTPTSSYQSDFEDLTFTPVKSDNSSLTVSTPPPAGGVLSAPPISTPTSNTHSPSSILLKLSPQLSGGESTRSQSLTPVPSERNEEDGDKTVTEQDSDDESEVNQEDTTILTEYTNGGQQRDTSTTPGGTTSILTEVTNGGRLKDTSSTQGGTTILTEVTNGGQQRNTSTTQGGSTILTEVTSGGQQRPGDTSTTQGGTTILTEYSNGGQLQSVDPPDSTILTEDDSIIHTSIDEVESSTMEGIPEDYSHDFEDDDDDDDVSDTSFRELLPSISHQRQHIMKRMKTPPITEQQPLTSSTHDLRSGEHSPSSVTGEESFFDFTSRMFNQYAKEEEMRAKHKLALLELREKAIQEKSEAELQWLKIKKGQVQKRGDDLAMPPLLKREKGILKKLKHEQAEIQRLKEAHRAATRERKMLLLQQQDIARIHHSASYYKDKIKRYGVAAQQHNSREPSPFTDLSQSPSPSPSISLSQEDIRDQFSSYNTSPNKSLSHSTTSIPDLIGQSTETNQTVPVLKSMPGTISDSESMKLRHKSTQEAERLLNKRSEELIKRRRKAEDLLRSEEELLKRKKELDEEEERINQILEQAKKCHKQIESRSTTVRASPSTRGNPPQLATDTGHSINESSAAIVTDISPEVEDSVSNSHGTTPAVEYGFDSFDSQVGVSATPTAMSTPRNSLEYIEELSQQLKVKEREIQEKKIKSQQTLELLEAGQIPDEDKVTTDIISSYTVPGSDKQPETTPIHETTPIDDILSPVSSGSSISTIISVNVDDGSGNGVDQHKHSLTEDKVVTHEDNDTSKVGGASSLGDSSIPEVMTGSDSSSIIHKEDTNIDDTPVLPPAKGDAITMNTRVMVGNKVEGTVRYIGETHFGHGVWIGVELDYEDGKNDGSVDGKRYFQCSPGYGIFAPPSIIRPMVISDTSSEEGQQEDTTILSEDSIEGDIPPAQQQDTKSIVTVERNVDIPVDDITEGLLHQLTSEAFDTVTGLKKAKANKLPEPHSISPQPPPSTVSEESTEGDGPPVQTVEEVGVVTDRLVDDITNDLLKVLVSSEVNVVCSIHSAKATPPPNEEMRDYTENNTVPPPPSSNVVPRPPPSTEDLVRQKSGSFSSETLSLVASSKNAIDAITHAAWTAVGNQGDDRSWFHRPPPEVVTAQCTMTPGPMLDCQESFINLVYQLAIETIKESRKKNSANNLASHYKPKEHSLQAIQNEVFRTIQECKKPASLPPTRFLNGNCRPCGKPIDAVDMLLIRELRDEEPSWVNYDKDQEEVKNRTADEILMLLIEDTASVVGSIYQKKYSR